VRLPLFPKGPHRDVRESGGSRRDAGVTWGEEHPLGGKRWLAARDGGVPTSVQDEHCSLLLPRKTLLEIRPSALMNTGEVHHLHLHCSCWDLPLRVLAVRRGKTCC